MRHCARLSARRRARPEADASSEADADADAAPTPAPKPTGQVPCTASGGGHYTCSWYVPGDGVASGTPVLSSTAAVVGYLHKGHNWIICQQQGAERSSGAYHNDWYGWTLSDHAGYGWANAVYASGGANDGQFAHVPNCNGAHGSPPSTTVPPAPAPTPTPPPPTTTPPIPGSGTLSAVRKKIVSLALAQRNYAPRTGHCDRYGKNLICPGDLYQGEWCSVMATWVWEQAGVNIPIFGYSGDPWYWSGSGGGRDGISGGHAKVLGPRGKAQPGDMVFFGTPSNSLHVAVVLKRYASGEILVMNGNDWSASAPDGIALESTFYPSTHGSVDGTGGPVYGYAEPERNGQVAAAASPAVRARIEAYLSQPPGANPVKGQDPRGPQKQHQKAERRHPAAQQMPYVGRRITVEVTNVRRSGTYVVEVLYRGSRASARRDFAHFLRRYHDPGKAYIVHYVKRSG